MACPLNIERTTTTIGREHRGRPRATSRTCYAPQAWTSDTVTLDMSTPAEHSRGTTRPPPGDHLPTSQPLTSCPSGAIIFAFPQY